MGNALVDLQVDRLSWLRWSMVDDGRLQIVPGCAARHEVSQKYVSRLRPQLLEKAEKRIKLRELAVRDGPDDQVSPLPPDGGAGCGTEGPTTARSPGTAA
jgi:hypothetical protein